MANRLQRLPEVICITIYKTLKLEEERKEERKKKEKENKENKCSWKHYIFASKRKF